MDNTKKYYIAENSEEYFLLLSISNGNIEYEIIDFEPEHNPPRLVVRDLDKNNRISIDYDLVDNIRADYPEYYR